MGGQRVVVRYSPEVTEPIVDIKANKVIVTLGMSWKMQVEVLEPPATSKHSTDDEYAAQWDTGPAKL